MINIYTGVCAVVYIGVCASYPSNVREFRSEGEERGWTGDLATMKWNFFEGRKSTVISKSNLLGSDRLS